jgi:hypothetical protein
VAEPLEEDEAQHPDLVEDPIFEELQGQVSEPDQSIVPLLSQEAPISKLGTESEMPEEVSEPDQLDHRNQEIRPPVSHLFDLASEKQLTQGHAHLIDWVPVSTVTENSYAMAQVELCSSAGHSRHGQWLRVEEGAERFEEAVPVCIDP